jgi:hypothetical protein
VSISLREVVWVWIQCARPFLFRLIKLAFSNTFKCLEIVTSELSNSSAISETVLGVVRVNSTIFRRVGCERAAKSWSNDTLHLAIWLNIMYRYGLSTVLAWLCFENVTDQPSA